ncbi:5246_t:CDS:2 [Diversispora eburnea]|uniref:5246_t:CDS:1 n=1 Tax=Diversispora eburnea TaxID=1213867 RepID=A0A9N8WHH0_9GLOM|nr:5246_t:CDS:2 [Diversispora eburnea]
MELYKLYILIFLIFVESSRVFSQNSTCNTDSACESLNDTLASCNGTFTTPSNNSVVYSVIDSNLASCQCNQIFYDNLTTCITCYNNTSTATNVSVVPLSDYKELCTEAGVGFDKKSSSTTSAAAGILMGVVIGIIFLIGLGAILWKNWNSNRLHPQLKLPDKKYDNENNKPPPSTSPQMTTVDLSSPISGRSHESEFSYLVSNKGEGENSVPPSAIRHQGSSTQSIVTPSSELFYGGITASPSVPPVHGGIPEITYTSPLSPTQQPLYSNISMPNSVTENFI